MFLIGPIIAKTITKFKFSMSDFPGGPWVAWAEARA
jgi:hypothetical protein